MPIPDVIESKIEVLAALCAKSKVLALYLFGSALTDQFGEKSDLDFLVKFEGVEPLDYADHFFDFQEALGNLFRRNIDLVEIQTLRNPYFKKAVEESKVLIYERGKNFDMAA